MTGFGFGFGSHRNSSARSIALYQNNPLPLMTPSLQWTGTAGSGFTSMPNDPVRSTAKPVLRLLVPPNQYYADELLVGVLAGANDNGSMYTNMGLRRVVVHFEGSSRSIDAPSFQSFADANGAYRTYFGWWTILRNDGRPGHAQVYFEAVPQDPTMQNRVIGPYQYSPQQVLHDGSITVAASAAADFQTLGAALAHCRSSAFNNPLVRIVEAGNYDIADGTQAYEGQGYCTIDAAVPGVRIAKPSYTNDTAAILRTRYAGLRFKGANLTIDTRNIAEIYSEPGANRSHWLDGCAIVNSAGQGALWRGVTRPNGWLVRDGGWFTECSIQDCSDAFAFAKLVRGTTATNSSGNLYSGSPVVVGNRSARHRSDTTLAKDIPAISVRYTGTAATATLELAGPNALLSRPLTVKIAGDADRIFTLDKSEAAYQAGSAYSLQHLVAWLNTIPGVAATLLDSSSGRAAAWLSLAGLSGSPFPARDIKSAALSLVTYVDIQSNLWEPGSVAENVIVWGNVATGTVARAFNMGGSGPKRDFLIANNAVQNDKTAAASAGFASELDGPNSHVVMVHNTFSTQAVKLRSDAAYASTAYDLVANNSVKALTWGGTTATTWVVNNHIHAGQTPPSSASNQANVTGTTVGGDDTTLYVNDKAGDFRANGLLATALAASVLRFNAAGEIISATDVKGAFKAAPQVPVARASSVTHYGITYTFSEERPVARYPTGDWKVQGPVTITSITPAATQVSGTFIQGGTYSNSWVNGAQVNPGNRSRAPGGLKANNKDNQPQGLNGIASITGYSGVRYNHAFNQDPAATGQPLVVTTGSVMKFVSMQPAHSSTRPGGTDMAVLTVVDDLGSDNALRPGVAQAAKTHDFFADDWDLTIFNNFPKVAGALSAAQLIAKVQRPYAMQFTDSVNSENAHAFNNHPNYTREIARQINPILLSLHFDYTAAEKIAILNGLYSIAMDYHERLMEGGDCVVPLGGASSWKKTTMCIVRASLRNAAASAKLAEMANILDYRQNNLFAEDKQLRVLTRGVINTPRNGSLSRPLEDYPLWMEGTVDYTAGGTQPEDGGSNWDSGYRTVFGCGGILGYFATKLTTGAMALWNRGDEPWNYWVSYYDISNRYGHIGSAGDTNYIEPLHGLLLAAAFPPDPIAPSVVTAKVDGTTLWLRFDKAMDEATAVPASAYTVEVNGVPAVGVTIAPPPTQAGRDNSQPPVPVGGYVPNGIFRTNVGLILPNAVIASDIVTVSYAGGTGANRLRSAHYRVAVAPFAGLAVENTTQSVGGINANYPVVSFDGTRPDRYAMASSTALSSTDAPRFTLWLPHIKLAAAPSVTVELFGQAGGSPTIEIQVQSDRRIRVIPRDANGSIISQLLTTALSLNTAYSLRLDLDATDPSATTGWSVYLNGTSAKSTNIGWSGGPTRTVGWTRASPVVLGGTATPNFTGEFGGIWLHTSERITDPTQVAKFTSMNNGNLDIGTLGQGITGTPPALFIVGSAAQWNDPVGINRGSAPKFFRLSGGVTDVSGANWR